MTDVLDTTVRCRECGCTDDDCRGCIERTGAPCSWAEPGLCTACIPDPVRAMEDRDRLTAAALLRLGELIARMPRTVDLGQVSYHPTSVTATLGLPQLAGRLEQLDGLHDLLDAARCTEQLYLNLRDMRAVLAQLLAALEERRLIGGPDLNPARVALGRHPTLGLEA